MKFQGAIVKEQGVSFAIVAVKHHVVNSQHLANKAINSFRPLFPGLPVVIMGQDSRGRPTYVGRKDIVRFLAQIQINQIPWREYSAN